MSVFSNDLLIRALAPAELAAHNSEAQLYVLLEDFPYQSDLLGFTVKVPEMFYTDFASIPRAVWNILDPEDPAILYPSVVHDYLYSIGGALPGVFVTRQQADQVLREAMGVCGATWWQKLAAYNAVNLFGASHWKPRS